MSQEELDPSHIMQVGMGFWPSKTLLSAVELELFTQLGADALTGEEIGERLGLHPRGDLRLPRRARRAAVPRARRRWRATAATATPPETAAFLDKRSPAYIGGILEMANARLYRFWGDLTEALRTGKPQNEIKHTGKPMFEELYSDPARLEQFMDAMQGISLGNFQALAEKFDFSRYETLCDVGGATGQLSMILAARHPHLRCTSFDLPVVAPIAEKAIAAAGLADRVDRRLGRLLRRPAAEGGRHHDGHDPARLEPREEDAPDPGGLRRAARGRRVHRRSRTSSTTPGARTPSG